MVMIKDEIEKFQRQLGGFYGTSYYYGYKNLRLTDGAKFLAEKGECYWLIDRICSLQFKFEYMSLQVWKIKVNQDRSCLITCSDGNHNIEFSEKIAFTDFVLPEIEIWVQRGVVFLPSEY